MMRTISSEEITKNIKEMCIEACHFLTKDMDAALKQAQTSEQSPIGKKILGQLQENLTVAGEEMIPICQDIRFMNYDIYRRIPAGISISG